MRLAIRHITRFGRDDSAPYLMQRLHLRPQSGPGQTVRAWQVTIEGGEPDLSYIDGFGNGIDLVRYSGARDEISIIAAGVVETQDRAGVIGMTDGYAPPWIFERRSEPPEITEQHLEMLMDDLQAESGRLDMLHTLMSRLHEMPRHAKGVEAKASDPAYDMPALFIATARQIDIPARYVTGYLMSDTGAQREAEIMSQSQGMGAAAGGPSAGAGSTQVQRSVAAAAGQPQSMHAWAEAFVTGLGWVGFDPLMNRCPDERYVRLAIGFGPGDTRAVTGFGAQVLAHEVSVIPAPELV